MLPTVGRVGAVGDTRPAYLLKPAATVPVIPDVPFDPLTNPKLTAYYSALDPSSDTPTQWLDLGPNAFHATKTGSITYKTGDASTLGKGAMQWPLTPSGYAGFLLPAMTVGEAIFVNTFGDGTDQSWGTNSVIFSGTNGMKPIIQGNSANSSGEFYTSTGLTAYNPIRPLKDQAPLPILMGVQNLRIDPAPMSLAGWRIGYYTSTTTSWRGSMSAVLLFSEQLTDVERLAYYDHLNNTFGTSAAVQSRIATKTGVAITRPAAMTSGNGTYYPVLVDMAGVTSFPGTHAVYYSSDHADGNGGIYMDIVNGDPSNPANYKTYDDAITDGDFDYLPTKPSSNPIYVDTVVGDQTETPHVMIIGGTIVMTYQNAGAGNNQSTVRALGTDGVNFTRDKVVVDYERGSSPGDSHTGYLRWGLNPFPDVPFTYVGYSLHGGQNQSYCAQWGCDDPINDVWTPISVLQKLAGRVKDGGRSMNWTTIDPASFRTTPQGISALVTMSADGAGASARDGAIYEVLLNNSGTDVLGIPIEVIGKTGLTFDAGEIADSSIVPQGAGFAGVYNAATTGNDKVIAAFSAIDNIAQVKFPPLYPVIPPTTDTLYDFSAVSSLPSGLSVVTAGAPSIAYTGNGINITATTGTPDGAAYVFVNAGFVPNAVDYVEFWAMDWKTAIEDGKRIPYFGFASSKVVPASITNGFYMDNGGGTSGLMSRNVIKAGTKSVVQDSTYGGFGYASYPSTAPKRIGFRWFVKENRFILLGEGGNEMGQINDMTDATIDKTLTYYFFFGMQSKGANVVESIKKVGIRRRT